MSALLPAFFFFILSSAFTTSYPSPGDRSQYDGDTSAMEQMETMNNSKDSVMNIEQVKRSENQQTKMPWECNDSHDCPENQYCHLSSDIAECQDCKTKDMLCQQDRECCLGWVCALSKCTERLSTESGGVRCDLTEDQCAPGFCCSTTERLPFPMCLPLLSRGEQCVAQASNFLKLIRFAANSDLDVQHCPCGEGLVCTSKGNLISTCEKADDVIDFTTYREDSLFQPLIRRDEELAYYDADLVPWPSQDDQLVLVDFPKEVEVNERDVRRNFQLFSADMGYHLKEENLHFDDHVDVPGDPSEADFQELKQLASEMGQYFGPGLY